MWSLSSAIPSLCLSVRNRLGWRNGRLQLPESTFVWLSVNSWNQASNQGINNKMNADKMPMVWVSRKPYVCSSCMKDEQFSRSSIRSITSAIQASRTHYLARTCSTRAISIINMEAMLLKAELYRRLACCPQNGQTIAFWGKPSMESYIRDALNLASSQTSPASQRKEYRSKTHKRLKERFLIRRNRTKRANFWCNNLFRATYNTTENT